ncbi:hypothetical protein HDU96_000968 [Phlyctochytrium bullatum]|nr:hypothetical protein HDU96_000968 [Phlyctochytrium bullatum]
MSSYELQPTSAPPAYHLNTEIDPHQVEKLQDSSQHAPLPCPSPSGSRLDQPVPSPPNHTDNANAEEALKHPLTQPSPSEQRLQMLRAAISLILINVILPIAIYSIGVLWWSESTALAVSAIPPSLEAVITLIRTRRPEPISSIVVVSIVFAIIVAVLTSDPRLLLVKDSFMTLCLGVGFLVSMGFRRGNLIWAYNRQMSGANTSPEVSARMDAEWADPVVRRAAGTLCVLWGVGFLVESGVRVALVYIIETRVMAYVSYVVMVVFGVGLTGITVLYVVRFRRRYAAMKAGDDMEAAAVAA